MTSVASSAHSAPSSVNRKNGSGKSYSKHSSTSGGSSSSSHMESSVTRLLVATKQLLESLTKWSQGRITEQDVSDIYVRLGNEFNVACRAFSKEGISMTELLSVPDQLRACLETCLSSEEVSPATLDQHLPRIREIIIGLLQGLKAKQQIYRSIVAERKNREAGMTAPLPPAPSDGGSISRASSPQTASSVLADYNGSRHIHSRSASRFSRTSDGSVPSRPTTPAGSIRRGSSMTANEALPSTGSRGLPDGPKLKRPERRVGGSMDDQVSSSKDNNTFVPPVPPVPERSSSNQNPPPATRTSDSIQRPPSIPSDRPVTTISSSISAPEIPPITPNSPLFPDSAPPPPPPPQIRIPDRTDTPPLPPEPPSEAQMSSLAALQKSDVLARRASKRFSAYTFNRMTGAPGKNDPAFAVGSAMMTLTGGKEKEADAGRELLNGISKDDRRKGKDSPAAKRAKSVRDRKLNMPTVEELEIPIEPKPEVPPLPQSIVEEAKPITTKPTIVSPSPVPPSIDTSNLSRRESSSSDSEIKVFLQLGRDTKKAKIDTIPTISSLRMLFMERFQYNPGMENFPSIYIRDTKVNVQYELEDMSEVQDGCVLSLNIEPLDQVKQHIDQGLQNLQQEIKDLKLSFSTLRRQSVSLNTLVPPVPADPVSPVLRPTENQFQAIAKKVLKLKSESLISNRSAVIPDPLTTDNGNRSHTPPVFSPTSITNNDGRVAQIVSDLKVNFDEVQNLRRDISVIRQVYDTFTLDTKQLFATLRSENEKVRRLANTKPTGARAFLEAGKSKLDSRTQELLTKIEELQDTVEDLKHDVTVRKIRPKSSQMANVRKLIMSTKEELASIEQFIASAKPTWKQTWANELQNIVDEQGMLEHQEGLLKDLQDDHEDFSAVFANIEQFFNLKGTTATRTFVPRPPKQGHQGLSTVMKEVQLVNSDPDRRMKALAQAEKAREQSLSSAAQDEFASDLASFVSGKMLKKTGGTEEVERIRQKKSAATLKAMFAGNDAPSTPAQPISSGKNEGTGGS